MKYRVTTYKDLNTEYFFVELGNHSYGQWIVYSDNKPAFHVDVFRPNSISDALIKNQIENVGETIVSIINKINQEFHTSLSFGREPKSKVESTSKLIDLDLKPIPVEWLENITQNWNL